MDECIQDGWMNARWMNYQKIFRHGKNIPINQTTEAVKKKCVKLLNSMHKGSGTG